MRAICSSMKARDLTLILDTDPQSLRTLRAVAVSLGCERVEADSAESLQAILATCQPTMAVLAMDGFAIDGLAMLRILAQEGSLPATLLIGTVHARVLAGARRTAESHGLRVIGVAARPLAALGIEQLLMPHLKDAPPIPLGELESALTSRTEI